MPTENLTEFLSEHEKTYDALAEQYEDRVATLLPVTQHAVDWMSEHVPKNGFILELGCGVGLAASLFFEKQFSVTGIDLSLQMLAYAKKRAPGVAFIQGDFLTTDFNAPFDGVFAFAFIHLFPKEIAQRILEKIYSILKTEGILYIGTTQSSQSKEGWETKVDYATQQKRYRKHWTREEFMDALTQAQFTIVDQKDYADPFGKVWMDVIAKKM